MSEGAERLQCVMVRRHHWQAMQSVHYMALSLLLGALAGCGGGGGEGGGGGGDGGGAGGGGASPQGPLVYTGNTNRAVITTNNAAQLTANILGGTDASAAVSAATATDESGARDVARRINSALRATPPLSRPRAPALTSIAVDDTQPCDSGSVRMFGDISQNGTGTLNISWNGCASGDSTLNGAGTVRIDAFDLGPGVITDATFGFQRLTLSSPNASGELTGSVRLQADIEGKRETTTSNVVTLARNGRMTKTENFAVVDVYDNIFSPASYTETIAGRVFDSVHGFVDIATDAAFVFGTLAQSFPSSGQIVLTGAANARIRAAASPRVVTLGLDLNGDGVFERTATLAWTELARPEGADLADNDGDGMHNSWETANGLNPFSALDRNVDSDGDSATNLAEYRAGTHANDPSSVPPSAASASMLPGR